MYLKIIFSTRIFYLGVKIQKLNFSKVIILIYFVKYSVKYRAVDKNNFLQQERGLAVRGLMSFNRSSHSEIS